MQLIDWKVNTILYLPSGKTFWKRFLRWERDSRPSGHSSRNLNILDLKKEYTVECRSEISWMKTEYLFFNILFCSQVPVLPPRIFTLCTIQYTKYSIWQDAGIRASVASTAARCASNELHTFLWATYIPMSYTHPYELHTSLWAKHIPKSNIHPYELHTSLPFKEDRYYSTVQ